MIKLKSVLVVITVLSMVVINSCTTKKEDGRIVIRYSGPGFMLYNKIREGIGKEFEKTHPNVKTVYEPVSGQSFFEKLQTQMASGTEPDIFFMRDFELPIFVEKKALLPLNDFINSDKTFNLKEFHKILIDSYSVNKVIYGLPGSFTTGVIFYNKNLLASQGLKREDIDNMDWKKLLKIALKLTKMKNNIVGQFGIVLEYYDWITFILQNNGAIFSPDKKRCIINSKSSVKAIKYLKSLFLKYHVMPNTTDLQQSSAYQLFMLNRAAMFTGGRWYTTTFNTIKTFNWGIAPFFYNKRRATRLDSHAWVISKRTKHKKIAWEFLKFLTSKTANWKMVEVGDSVPIHKSNIKKFLALNPENKVFIESLKYAYTVDKVMSPYINWREQQVIFNQEFGKFILNKTSAEETLKNIEERVNTSIKQYIKENNL